VSPILLDTLGHGLVIAAAGVAACLLVSVAILVRAAVDKQPEAEEDVPIRGEDLDDSWD
jgi:hypothetical protein